MQFKTNYDSRVVIYERKMLIRLATEVISARQLFDLTLDLLQK